MNALFFKILHDKTPTTDAKSERYLAVALGYPTTWRVRRRLVTVPCDEADSNANRRRYIQDIIYAGNPSKGVDQWYNHEAAMLAALTSTGDNPYQFKGGHLVKMTPKFQKGDEVEVKYGRQWYAATILRRKDAPEGTKYSVQYIVDASIQDHVRETNIRMAPAPAKALELASSMGLPEGWECKTNGKNKYIFTSPTGLIFRTKRAAINYIRETLADDDDPPWRTSNHELLQRRVKVVNTHPLSGRRSIRIEQLGYVVGWISATDCDRLGNPGYTSEITNQPAALFHVVFDEARGHPHFKYLVESQDMEEAEVRKCLVDDSGPPAKKAKRSM